MTERRRTKGARSQRIWRNSGNKSISDIKRGTTLAERTVRESRALTSRK